MSSEGPQYDIETLESEAAAWLARLDSGALSKAEMAAFEEWLQTSPGHRRQWDKTNVLWQELDLIFEPLESPRVSENRLAALAASVVAQRPFAAGATAFMALLLVVSLAFVPSFLGEKLQDRQYAHAFHASEIGEQEFINLPDGSSVRLNTDSEVEIDFSPATRAVRLLRGEAIFEVAHDADRPFQVFAGSGVVRAVGTAFSVRLYESKLEVIVTEGKVDLGRARRAQDQPMPFTTGEGDARLVAGQRAFYDSSVQAVETIDTLDQRAIEQNLSWQTGMLVFERDRLEDVVNEVGRYSKVHIVITDPATRELRLGGYFKTGEVDALLRALENGFDLEVRRENNNFVYISGPAEG